MTGPHQPTPPEGRISDFSPRARQAMTGPQQPAPPEDYQQAPLDEDEYAPAPPDERRQAPPWLRALIAFAIIFGLGAFSLAVPGLQASQPDPQVAPTPTFGAFIQVATRIPTPTRIRIPTRLPDAGSNKNGDMCTVIASEHAARPSVPMCGP